MKSKLKSEYARKLIESGIKPYSVVRHSYTNHRLTKPNDLMRVQSVEIGICPTLDTRCDCFAVVVIEDEK